MYVINANNINHAFKQGLELLLKHADPDTSRNGAVIRIPEPVTTVYAYPRRRVLDNRLRNANPFFHLMEALWMLAGRNDIAFVKLFNARMAEYSDDSVTQPAAYGHRWRRHFMVDQLAFVICELRQKPNSRRAVLTMADPVADVSAVINGGADVPCNTSVYFIIRTDGHLDMTVSCRSNDAIWGCYGANAVHMSMLHEYVAACVGVDMGRYYQVSNDLHAYTDIFSVAKLRQMADVQMVQYGTSPLPMNHADGSMTKFNADLETFFFLFDENLPITSEHFCSDYFIHVVAPMWMAWRMFKSGNRRTAMECAGAIQCGSWSQACTDWLNDTYAKKDSV